MNDLTRVQVRRLVTLGPLGVAEASKTVGKNGGAHFFSCWSCGMRHERTLGTLTYHTL